MDIQGCIVPLGSQLLDAMLTIDRSLVDVALVVDGDSQLVGVVSHGDIRRAMVRGFSMASRVEDIMERNVLTLDLAATAADHTAVLADSRFQQRRLSWIPVVDQRGCPVDIEKAGDLRAGMSPAPADSAFYEKSPNIMVVGGAGYVGNQVVRELLTAGYRVTVFDAMFYGDAGLVDLKDHPRLRIVIGDTRHVEDLVNVMLTADAVVHLGEILGDPVCAKDPNITLQVNYLGTANVALAAKALGINRYIYFSSCSVYGSSADPATILTETSNLAPVSLYARTKIRAEQVIRPLIGDGFAPTIFRLGTVFGLSPKPRFDLVVNTFTGQAVQDGAIQVFGGDQWRPHVHCRDVARAVLLALETPIDIVGGQTMNIVGENYTIDDVARIVHEIVPDAEVTLASTDVDRRNYRVSGQKATDIIGFVPQMTVRQGVIEIAQALRDGTLSRYTTRVYSNMSLFDNASLYVGVA